VFLTHTHTHTRTHTHIYLDIYCRKIKKKILMENEKKKRV